MTQGERSKNTQGFYGQAPEENVWVLEYREMPVTNHSRVTYVSLTVCN